MTARKDNLSASEIARAFADNPGTGGQFGPILDLGQVSELLGATVSTVRDWKAKGRLEGCYRKRGKHLFFWRDHVIEKVFNGPDWGKE